MEYVHLSVFVIIAQVMNGICRWSEPSLRKKRLYFGKDPDQILDTKIYPRFSETCHQGLCSRNAFNLYFTDILSNTEPCLAIFQTTDLYISHFHT